MFLKIDRHSYNGFTLIEIIASIAILTMIIAVFLPMFPQIVKWTNNAEDELVTSNLLGQIAYEVKNDPSIYSDYTINKCNSEEPVHIKYRKETDYNVELIMCQEEKVNLYRTNIRIYSFDYKLLSESFTYVGEDND